MNRKGILTKEQQAFLVEVIFFFAKFKNKALQWAARPIIAMIIEGIDDFILDKINPEWKARVIPIVDKGALGQFNEVRQLASDIAADEVKIPYTSRDRRMEFADSLSRTIVSGVALYSEYREGKLAA